MLNDKQINDPIQKQNMTFRELIKTERQESPQQLLAQMDMAMFAALRPRLSWQVPVRGIDTMSWSRAAASDTCPATTKTFTHQYGLFFGHSQ
jgi:hypothetical protein